MEQRISFEEWVKTIVPPPKEEYYLTFDENGIVTGMHPDHAVVNVDYKLKINDDLAESIYEGKESLSSLRIDIRSMQVMKVNRIETTGLVKIDDVLHRIVEKKWSNITEPDINIQYSKENSSLIFIGNKKHTNVIWSGDTVMLFLVTEYNDPNYLKNMINITVGDILEKPVEIEIPPMDKFSIYTRRVFDKYTFEKI